MATGFSFASLAKKVVDLMRTKMDDSRASEFAKTSHSHDDRYYTEDEIDVMIGNAGGATNWPTARTLTYNLSGDASGSGSMSVDGSSNKSATIDVTVKDDSHTHDTRYDTKAQVSAKVSAHKPATIWPAKKTLQVNLTGAITGTGSAVVDGSANVALNVPVTMPTADGGTLTTLHTYTGGWMIQDHPNSLYAVYTQWGDVKLIGGNPSSTIYFARTLLNTNYHIAVACDMADYVWEQGPGYSHKTTKSVRIRGSWDGGAGTTVSWKVTGFIAKGSEAASQEATAIPDPEVGVPGGGSWEGSGFNPNDDPVNSQY